MKEFDYYSMPQATYPQKGKYTLYFVYEKGKVIFEGSTEEFRKEYPTGTHLATERDFDREAWKRELDAYNLEVAKLKQEFMDDLYEEFGVKNHPKRDLCFQIAWEHGHSAGYYEVHMWFEELVELIQD